MLKYDYGHLGCPYYYESLPSGMDCYFIPRKTRVQSAALTIKKGTYQNAKLKGADVSPLTAHLLANAILDDQTIDAFHKLGVSASLQVDLSTVTFSLSTVSGPLYDCLQILLDRVANPCYDEAKLDAVKKKLLSQAKDPSKNGKSALLKGLYISAPIQEAVLPSFEGISNLHASQLKRYQSIYYTSDRAVLFLSLDEDPKASLEKVKSLKGLRLSKEKEEPLTVSEDYDKVYEDYTESTTEISKDRLLYGIKFPARKDIYEAYGESAFFLYEILPEVAFSENEDFLKELYKLESDLLDVEFFEAGEDACIILSIQTDRPQEVVDKIAAHLSSLSKKLDAKAFERIKQNYYIDANEKLSSSKLVTSEFVRTFPNHIAYPSLVSHTYRLAKSTMKHFLADFKTFRRAAHLIKAK